MFYSLLVHAMKAFFPTHGDLPGIGDLDVEVFVRDELLQDLHGMMRVGVLASTLAFVLLPFWTVWRPVPSFLLSEATLDRHAQNMAGSEVYLIRSAALLIKMVGGFHWARHASVRSSWALEPYPKDPDTWRAV